MFVLVGNLNFVYHSEEFSTPFDAMIIMVDSSMGNFDFEIFSEVEDPNVQLAGKLYILASVILFTILILNLIIAILSNTYTLFSDKSIGLYLSKIISTRVEFQHDENYSAFIMGMSPLNLIILPFVPIMLIIKPNPQLNYYLMITQYCILMFMIFIAFFIISILLIPIAFIQSLIFKLRQAVSDNNTPAQMAKAIASSIMFLFTGLFIMVAT